MRFSSPILAIQLPNFRSAAVATLAKARLMTRGLIEDESDNRSPVPRSNPGAATFAFAKLRKRDFRRPHPQV